MMACFLPMSKLNAAILFKNILGVLLTERDWNPNYPENCDGKCFFHLSGLLYGINSAENGDFSGTVILNSMEQ